MKKLRILAIVMAAVLTLAVLVSCGGKTETPSGSDAPAGPDAPADEVKGAMDEHGYYKV